MRSRFRILALIPAALLWGSCAVFEGPAPVTEQERSAYASAIAALPDRPDAAQRQLEAFVETWPGSPLADSARVRIAGIEVGRGDREAARRALVPVRFSQLSRDERRTAYRILADAATDPVHELRWLASLRAEETEEDAVARVDVEIDELLRTLGAADHERAAEQIGRRVPAARVLLSAAEQALDAGELSRARRAVDRAARLPLAPQYAARMGAISERLRLQEEGPRAVEDLPSFAEVARQAPPSTGAARGTLGVLLPLSGDFAGVGEESLRGVMLAAEVFAAGERSEDAARGWGFGRRARSEAPSIRLLIRDTAGRPERAAQAVRELARNDEVSAIIGPLVKTECEAAAAEAEAAGVPLLALTSREDVAAGRPHVFRTRTTPEEEVAVLVNHAFELGARRFAILYPADAYGRGLRSLFWDSVEEHGGRIVGVAAYEPDATDFAGPIRRLVGYTLLTEEQEDAIGERAKMLRRARRLPDEEALALREEARGLTGPDGGPLPPIVDFDALFIPEAHDKVVLIAPQLAYHEAVGMRLLGPSGWYHPDLVTIGRDHVREALLAAQFYPDSALPFVRRFADSYEAVFSTRPDAFAAQAFDATNLVLVQLARGLSSREAIREGVLATRGYPGVAGVLSMRSDGNARRRPFLLAVERGRFVQVDGPLN